MAANVYTINQYAAKEDWGGIDALDSRTRRAKGVAVQRRLLRDACTLRDANGEVVPFDRHRMKQTNSLTGVGGVLDVLVAWGVTTIVEG